MTAASLEKLNLFFLSKDIFEQKVLWSGSKGYLKFGMPQENFQLALNKLKEDGSLTKEDIIKMELEIHTSGFLIEFRENLSLIVEKVDEYFVAPYGKAEKFELLNQVIREIDTLRKLIMHLMIKGYQFSMDNLQLRYEEEIMNSFQNIQSEIFETPTQPRVLSEFRDYMIESGERMMGTLERQMELVINFIKNNNERDFYNRTLLECIGETFRLKKCLLVKHISLIASMNYKVIEENGDWILTEQVQKEKNLIGEEDKRLIRIDKELIPKLHLALKKFFSADVHDKLLNLLEGKEIEGKLRFQHNGNRLAEVFKRAEYNDKIQDDKTQIKDWMCQWFEFGDPKKGESKPFKPSVVYDVLSKDAYEPTGTMIIPIEGLEYKSLEQREKEKTKN